MHFATAKSTIHTNSICITFGVSTMHKQMSNLISNVKQARKNSTLFQHFLVFIVYTNAIGPISIHLTKIGMYRHNFCRHTYIFGTVIVAIFLKIKFHPLVHDFYASIWISLFSKFNRYLIHNCTIHWTFQCEIFARYVHGDLFLVILYSDASIASLIFNSLYLNWRLRRVMVFSRTSLVSSLDEILIQVYSTTPKPVWMKLSARLVLKPLQISSII